jgi:chromosome segregation ATPase
VHIYKKQLAIFEMQLDECGVEMQRIPELETQVSFLSDFSEELRQELEAMHRKLTAGQDERDHTMAGVCAEDTDDAVSQLQKSLAEKATLEERFKMYTAKTRELKSSYEERLSAQRARAEKAEADLKRFQTETKEFFAQQQASWHAERDKLEAELSEALEAKRNWEDHLAANSVSAKVRKARLIVKSNAELADEIARAQNALLQAQQDAEAARMELEEFRTKTAEMWELHQDSVKSQMQEELGSRDAEIEALRRHVTELEANAGAGSSTASQRIAELEAEVARLRELADEAGRETLTELEEGLQTVREQTLNEAHIEFERRMQELRDEFATERRRLQRELEDAATVHQEAEAAAEARNHDLSESMEKVQEELKRLQQTAADEERERGAARSSLNQREIEVSTLETRLREHKAAAEAARLDVERLKAHVASREEEKQGLLSLLEDLNARLAQLEKEHRSVTLARDSAAAQAITRLEQLREQHARELDEKVEELAALRRELQSRTRDLQEQLAARDRKIAELEHRASLMENGRDEAERAQIAEMEKLQRRIADLEEASSTLQREREAQAADHAREMQTREAQLRDLAARETESAGDLARRAEALEADLRDARAGRQRAAEEFSAALAKKQAALTEAQEEHTKAVQALRVAQAEAEAAARAAQRAQQDGLDRVNAELLAAREAAIAQRRESELALAQARRRVDELEAQREAVASGHAQELEAARADARQQLSDVDVVKSKQRRALARLEKRVTELTAALSHSEETNATTREGLRLQLSQRERELADVEAQLELVRRESQRRLQEQEASLKQVRRRLQAAERGAEAAQLASRDKAAPAVDAAEVARLKEALEAARAQAATEEGKLRRARDEAEARLLERDALFEAERGEFALWRRIAEAREAGLRTEVDEAHAERLRAASDWADRLRQRQERLANLEKEHAIVSAELRARIVGLTQALLEAQAEAQAESQAAARDKAAALTGLHIELTRAQAELQSAQARVAELEASALAGCGELTRAEREYASRADERVALQEAAHRAAMEQIRAQAQRLQDELHQACMERGSAATAFAEKLAEKQRAMKMQQAQHEDVMASLKERMAQINARLEESNNARSRLSAQLQAMAEAGRRPSLSEADGTPSVWAPTYRAKGGLVGAGVGSGGNSGMSMADETPVTSNGGDLKKNTGGLFYGGNDQPTGLGRGSSVERGMDDGPRSPTLLIEKQMALDSRNRQLELELENALAARQRAAEEFQQRLQAMRRQLDDSEAERLKFAQQLRLITVDGLLGNNHGDEDSDLKNLNGKSHLLINRKFELSSNSRSEATTREYDLY